MITDTIKIEHPLFDILPWMDQQYGKKSGDYTFSIVPGSGKKWSLYRRSDGLYQVSFINEEDYIWFKLKWSK